MKPAVSTTHPPSDRKYLYFIVEHFKITLIIDDELDRFRQDLVGKTFIITDETNSNCRQLPEIIIFNFGDRDVELISQAGSNRLNDLSFTFERQVIRQSQLYFTYADIHYSIIAELPA